MRARNTSRWGLGCVGTCLGAALGQRPAIAQPPAAAQPSAPSVDQELRPTWERAGRVALQSSMLLGLNTAWYWRPSNREGPHGDWDLQFDGASWRRKTL